MIPSFQSMTPLEAIEAFVFGYYYADAVKWALSMNTIELEFHLLTRCEHPDNLLFEQKGYDIHVRYENECTT